MIPAFLPTRNSGIQDLHSGMPYLLVLCVLYLVSRLVGCIRFGFGFGFGFELDLLVANMI